MTIYSTFRDSVRWLNFWRLFIGQTLSANPNLRQLTRVRCGDAPLTVEGSVPSDGHFVLAVNHYNGRHSLDVGAAVLCAVAMQRPDAVEMMGIVVGQRQKKPPPRWFANVLNWFYNRWARHVIRVWLPPRNATVPAPVKINGLRDWRQRQQPIFVFPEGRVRLALGTIRPGSGRWLKMLGMPVIPVAVWWQPPTGWQVRFGAPIAWTSARPDLYDVQLGLNMAALLPPELAQDWQDLLNRWQQVTATQHAETESREEITVL